MIACRMAVALNLRLKQKYHGVDYSELTIHEEIFCNNSSAQKKKWTTEEGGERSEKAEGMS